MNQTPKLISFHYTLTDGNGTQLDTSEGSDPLSYIEGKSQIIPGLEKRLSNLEKGTKTKVSIQAAEAYGVRDESLAMQIPAKDFPDAGSVEVGDQYRMQLPNDRGVSIVTVTSVSPDTVAVDGNHPLAGIDLHFDVEIVESREATTDELESCGSECGCHETH